MKTETVSRSINPLKPSQMVGKYIPQNPHMRKSAFSKTEVDNPYAIGEQATKSGAKERVYRRTSDNPLLVMYNRGSLNDAQYLAARKYLNAHLICTGQMGQGTDYSRQRVDCSPMPTTLTERQLQASDIIRNANRELMRAGQNEKDRMEAMIRVQKIIGEEWTAAQYCEQVRGLTSSKSVKKQLGFLRDDLTLLAKYWGLER